MSIRKNDVNSLKVLTTCFQLVLIHGDNRTFTWPIFKNFSVNFKSVVSTADIKYLFTTELSLMTL